MRLKKAIQTAISEKSFYFIKYYFTKENREENAAHKRCLKRVKATRKKMKELAKFYGPWDWGYIHDYIKLAVDDMYEYYSIGDNVWQADESRLKVVKQLAEVKELFDEIDRFEDEAEPQDFESINEYLRAEQKTYDDLYTFIGKNIRWWWD